MLQKKKLILVEKKHLLGLIAVIGVVSALWCQSFVSLADSTGTVKADSANIRAKADTNSEVVGSAAHGMKVSIKNEVQDSSGTLWYEVYVDANTTGYIRSDLVDKADGNSGSQSDGNTTSPSTQAESSASGASVDPDTVLDAQYATVSPEVIIVRTAPSTNEAVVDRLNRDAQVIISGESAGSDGKTWFYVTFTGTGDVERSGYIRSDLLSRGDMVPVPEEVTPEPQETVPEPEEPVNSDYKLTYEPSGDGSGTYEWYLYDYTIGDGQHDKYRVSDLMTVTKQRSEMDAKDAKTLVRQRVAIVILIVLLVALVVAAVIMALKLREVYYEDYEDEDEEEEEQSSQRRRRTQEAEDDSTKRRRRTEEGEEVSARSRRRAEESDDGSAKRRRRAEENDDGSAKRRRRAEESDDSSARRRRRMEESEEESERSARRRSARDERESGVREVEYREDDAGSATVKTAPKRKAKNFLLDDDEFEFEFLNMDDKGM